MIVGCAVGFTHMRRLAIIFMIPMLISACSSPLSGPDHGPFLDKGLTRIIEQEMQAVDDLEQMATADKPSDIENLLASRREQLDAMTPVPPGADLTARLGPDLSGEASRKQPINIDQAVRSAVINNLDLQNARLQPAIKKEEVIQASAVFDIVLGAGVSFTRPRVPTTIVEDTNSGNQALNVGLSRIEQFQYNVDLAKKLTTGGQVRLSTSMDRQLQKNFGDLRFQPNPGVNPIFSLELEQPILRGFGEAVNLADVFIARKLEESAIEDLRSQLIITVTETEIAYWDLAMAWRNLAIQQWLVEAAEQLLDLINRRRSYDANIADWAQAVATVEERRVNIINFQQSVKEASDYLKLLMNNPDIPLSGETVLEPEDEMVHTAIELELRESILKAIANRPDVRKSLYEIDIAEINEVVADNGRLPELDLQASVSTEGLGKTYGEGYSGAFTGNYISYLVGLVFQYPLGNRAPEAAFRASRLERSSSMVAYRRTLLQVVLDVKTAMRDVLNNARLITATRVSRVAAAESLRALEVERQTLASLTPTFLNLLFTTQAQLGNARSAEFQAIVDFNKSVSKMYESMGMTLNINQIGLQTLDENSEFDPNMLY